MIYDMVINHNKDRLQFIIKEEYIKSTVFGGDLLILGGNPPKTWDD